MNIEPLIVRNTLRKFNINTLHGQLVTPYFLPDATYGTIHSLGYEDLDQIGIGGIVTTTLHIEQKLGSDYIQSLGGMHNLIKWQHPILTDSGGFQVFSLIHRNKENKHNRITDAGCSFIDYATGDFNFLSPEQSQFIQHKIGSDIRVVLDEPVIEDDSLHKIKKSVIRTTEWAKRSKTAFLELLHLTENDFNNPEIPRPLLTAVIQGGNNFQQRKASAEALAEIGFDIYGFGGIPKHDKLSWKEDASQGFYHELISYVANLIPIDKIRYGLGIGSPDDLEFAVKAGWDIFDTVLPTRNARHGYLYVHKGQGDREFKSYDVIHIKSLRYQNDNGPIDEHCQCLACKTVSRAFLRYLIRIQSPTGYRYATIHNLSFYRETMDRIKTLCC
jgi:queuine tRNA-ribosyltransferase